MYRASVGITTNMKSTATSWIAENAAYLGADGIWIGEDIDIGQDIFVLTAATLLQSEKVRVGIGITPMTIHNISTLARAGLTLQEIGQGRFVFGTGVGGMQDLQRMGIMVKKPVTALRLAIGVLRELWAGKTVSVENELFKLDEYSLRIKGEASTPIFLGVRGPQMLKLAGQLADGVILSGPLDYLKIAGEIVDKSAVAAGRHPNSVEKVAWLPTIPTFKGGEEKLAKKVVSIVVADTPDPVLDMLSIDRARIDRLRTAVAESGPSGGIPHVDQEIMDMFAISGNCEQMVDRFDALGEIGMTEVVLGPPFSGDWRGAMSAIFQEIQTRRGV